MTGIDARAKPEPLMRSLTLGHALLYGLGVTIGAGIYVLIGAASGIAGYLTPLAFLFAAALLVPTGASLAELASRLPFAAGEAAYVRAGFRSEAAALFVGLLTASISIISAAAIAVGSAGYISVFVHLADWIIIAAVVIAMGGIAAWGIRESVTFAGIMTLIEIGGLVLIIVAGFASGQAFSVVETAPTTPAVPHASIFGLLLASMLAVFAFVGFEALANVAEEVEEPSRNLPIAIFATLGITTVLYVLVVWVALTAVGPVALSQSKAPLALVFERLTGFSPLTMGAIAIVATLNGIIVQVIMSSRIFYGLARQGNLPAFIGRVNSITHTPIISTALTTAIVLVLAIAVPLEDLALFSSRLLLGLFVVINAALIAIKRRDPVPDSGVYLVPYWMPWLGIVTTAGFLVADIAGIVSGR